MPSLLIIGASTRAAAFSARRAGWSPLCVDEFGDRDLAAVATFVRSAAGERASAFGRLSADRPEAPWLYTGPIENSPELVDQLASCGRLLGNRPAVLRSIRDPIRVAAVLEREALAHAEVRPDELGLPRDGTWLLKPIASGGGRLIRPLVEGMSSIAEPCYYQQFVDGECCSALFLADRDGARLLGATRQLHGGPAGRFAYRGNIGPIPISAELSGRLGRLGEALVGGFGLLGLFGVDYILRDHEPCLVEINPRYTASVEVLELALGRSLLRDHLEACGLGQETMADDASSPGHRPFPRVVGKEVIYAERNIIAPEIPLTSFSVDRPFLVPQLADVPWPGTLIARGEPIMTILAEGPDEAGCLARLEERAARWREFLGGTEDRHGTASPQA